MPRVFRNLLLLLASGLCACTLSQLAYDHLDLLARHYVAGFVELKPEQQRDFDTAFGKLWQWHRHTELPAYADLLRAIADTTASAQTPAQLDALAQQADTLGETLGARVLHDFAPLIAELDDAQVAATLAEIDRRIVKSERHDARQDDADWHREQIEDSEDSLKKYAGPLEPAQRERIHAWGAALSRDAPGVERAARAWRAQLAGLLTHRRDADFASQLQSLMQPASAETRAAEARRQQARTGYLALLSDLSASYTEGQRQHLQKSLSELADDLQVLADEKP